MAAFVAEGDARQIEDDGLAGPVSDLLHRDGGSFEVFQGGGGVAGVAVDVADRHQRMSDSALVIVAQFEVLKHGQVLFEAFVEATEGGNRPGPMVARPRPRRRIAQAVGQMRSLGR